jgi:hypothetical protein
LKKLLGGLEKPFNIPLPFMVFEYTAYPSPPLYFSHPFSETVKKNIRNRYFAAIIFHFIAKTILRFQV